MRQKGLNRWLLVVFLLLLLVLYWVHRSRLASEQKTVTTPVAQQNSHGSATCYDAKGNPYSQGFIRTSPLNNNLAQVCGAKGKWEPYSSTEKK